MKEKRTLRGFITKAASHVVMPDKGYSVGPDGSLRRMEPKWTGGKKVRRRARREARELLAKRREQQEHGSTSAVDSLL
jgi:hypothetical protein